ncbi:MAG: hypothetical protein A2Y38_19020 [Spirochaetes bacterium GWB1_59_5]|nr:MAG: hypothetical protein A2Y38_19020 [Spirochaetes bacterium GWB1_59_5]
MRVSSFRLLSKCNGWVDSDLPVISVENPYARMGTEAHSACAAHVLGQPIPPLSKEAKAGFDKFTEYLADHPLPTNAPQVLVEKQLTNGIDTGHPDLVFRFPDIDILIDYKFGFKDLDYEWNMRGYAGLLIQNPVRPHHAVPVRAIIMWIQDGSVQTWEWSVGEIQSWWREELDPRRSKEATRTFTVGEHCQYCPIYHSCPERIQIGRASAEIVTIGQTILDMRTPKSILQVWDAATIVEKAAGDLKDYIKGHFAAGGEVEYQGEVLEFRLQNGPPAIDTPRAIEVLTTTYGIGAREIVDVAKIPLGEMVGLVTKHSAPGKKKSDEERLRHDLLAAKAITPTTRLVSARKTIKELKGGTS